MENPKIEWKEKSGTNYLHFTFNDKFTELDAISATRKWRDALSTKPGTKIVLIWDCLNMKGYDQSARSKWQSACKELKGQIENIWVVSNSLMIKMGANVISAFTSMKIHVVSSENEITL